MPKITRAMVAAPAAIPPNPRTAATSATTRKMTVQYNIKTLLVRGRLISVGPTRRDERKQMRPPRRAGVGSVSCPGPCHEATSRDREFAEPLHIEAAQ